MEDKLKAYKKILMVVESSKNELHLQTCAVMTGIFMMRFEDESLEGSIRYELDKKREEILRSN